VNNVNICFSESWDMKNQIIYIIIKKAN